MKVHTKHLWGKWVASAAVVALCILLLSNGEVRASLKELFGGNKAVQIAEEQGFFNEVDEKAADRGITLQLTKVFADAGHIGFQINGQVENTKLLKNVESVYFNYYIKDAQGNYVIDQLGDERFELKSGNPYQIGTQTNTLKATDSKAGTFTQQVIMESSQGLIPNLDKAVIEIVSISFSAGEGKTQTIDGVWEMPFTPEFESKSIPQIAYQASDVEGDIEEVTAIAEATGMRVAFKCKQGGEVLELLSIKLIHVVLPYSAFQEAEVLKLEISNRRNGEMIGTAALIMK